MKAQGTWLEKMVQRALAELPARKKAKAPALLATYAKAAPRAPPFEQAVRRATGTRVIAELKRRTPRAFLDRDLDLTETAREFERGGACALMVATEGPHFGGTVEDLARARAGSRLPLLRRDMLIDPYQLAETRVAGASAALLVATVLEGKTLPEMLRAAAELSLETVVEVHDQEELDRALDAGAAIVAIDPRHPRSFEATAGLTQSLAARAHKAGALVLAGGVETPADVARLVAEGADAVLVGTCAILAGDRAQAVRALVGA